MESVFNSPFQDLAFFTALCKNPASQRSITENGSGPLKCSLLRLEHSGRTWVSCLFSCLLPRCWEVNRGGRAGFGLAKAVAVLPSSDKSPGLSIRGLVTFQRGGDAPKRGSGAGKDMVLTDRPSRQGCGSLRLRHPEQSV